MGIKLKRQFKFPLEKDVAENEFTEFVKNNRVLVIGVFGKSKFGGSSTSVGKADFFDAFLQRDGFRISAVAAESSSDGDFVVEGFHDRVTNTIYLHLRGGYDGRILVNRVLKAESEIREKGFQDFYADLRSKNVKNLLFLFHVCHILICFSPVHCFDVSYVSLFQTLDDLRLKFQSSVSDCIRECPSRVSKDWLTSGRFCTPRILFYFDSAPIALRGSKGTMDLVKKDGKPSKHPPIRKFEFSLEDQIYHILKNAKIVTSNSSALFVLPVRDGYVYVNNGTDDSFGDSMAQNLKNLYSNLESPKVPDELASPFEPYFYSQAVEESRETRSFSKFLSNHVESAFSRNEGGSSSNFWELPKAGHWYDIADSLFKFFDCKDDDDEKKKVPSTALDSSSVLQNYSQLEFRFSEARCAKALPQAVAAYKEGLQAHYLEEYHNAKLLQALALFSVQARGPRSSHYAELLAEECTAYWTNGKQMCEALSLTGRHCTHRKHLEHSLSNDEDNTAESKNLPTMAHLSGITFVSSCNCGRHQEPHRDDPFSLFEANHGFYKRVQRDCCQGLEQWEIPTYQEPEAQASFRSSALNTLKESSSSQIENLTKAMDELGTTSASKSSKKSENVLAGLASVVSNEVEGISYMLTGDLPVGKFLPTFPSWSLVQLGSASLYSHSSGLSQPGFLSGSKHLLMWDVPMTKVEFSVLREKWPTLAENAAKKPSFNPKGKGIEMGITVKVFLGLEYECPRGHRFIASSPEQRKVTNTKVSKTSSSSLRDSAGKIAGADMPLYIVCSCSSARSPCLGQLMRIHIVTPKAPIHVALDPQVSPPLEGRNGPKFITGWTHPINLPSNTYWVLRLPYIYCGKDGAHVPPSDIPQSDKLFGRFLKGSITINEDYQYTNEK